MENLNLKIQDKAAILEFDQPDSKVNVLNTALMQEFSSVIDDLSGRPESEISALVITSRKDRIFIAGADIKEIEHIDSAEKAEEKADYGKEIFERLSRLDLITVAAINGVCLGGGLELALACDYRAASFSDDVKIGLPEVRLGIIPGWLGTQRLPRLIGLTRALTMILSGRTTPAREALRYGLVDRLFPGQTLVDDSIDFAMGISRGTIKVERARKRKLFLRFLEGTSPGRAIVFNKAKRDVLKRTKGFYPAPLRVIDLMKRTYGMDIKTASIMEGHVFSELVLTEASKNLIKVFYLNEEYKKFPWMDKALTPVPVNKCGIVGAGVMGGGIAQLVSFNGIPVRLKDINCHALKRALMTAHGIFEHGVKRKKIKRCQADYRLGLISPTLGYKGFENAGLVIEAVVEDAEVKEKVFGELNSIVPRDTIIASNTSSLKIAKLLEHVDFPERVVGLHFFNPVHRMGLVEVIRSSATGDKAMAEVIAFARHLGKTAIVVKDAPGFLINRIILPYLNESGFLLEDGMKMGEIDKIAMAFGMPMGPLELIDEIGVDVGYKVAKILEDSFGPRMQVCPVLEKVKDRGLLGKKTGYGFYIHKGKKKIPNPSIYDMVKSSRHSTRVSDGTALKRMIYIMVNEAANCLGDGVVDRPHTVDIGMIMGSGFPPFRGGLLRYADETGIANIAETLSMFKRDVESPRFKPCKHLLEMAEKNRRFYP